MRLRILTRDLWLPLTPEEIFPFFANAANLEAITPPTLSFKVITPLPIAMQEGTLIDYKLRIHGFPVRWRTRIAAWQPPHRFVDEQLRGPYRQWIHEHTFEARDGGTLCREIVQYAAPFDLITHQLFVRREVEATFAFRAEALKSHFARLPKNA
jgi:ligand-binding SRPBCC domain-containing protein